MRESGDTLTDSNALASAVCVYVKEREREKGSEGEAGRNCLQRKKERRYNHLSGRENFRYPNPTQHGPYRDMHSERKTLKWDRPRNRLGC